MKKITSGDNITVIIDGKPHIFIGNSESNGYVKTFLDLCDDEDQIRGLLDNPAYVNYLKSYNEYPEPGTKIFNHGHKLMYLCLNESDEFPYRDVEGNLQYSQAMNILDIQDIAVGACRDSEEQAKKEYRDLVGSDATQLLICCTVTKVVHSITDLVDDTTTTLSKGEIIDVA